ncbi:TetR/AcrR family transcriptional regulator [Streptosporangium sp. NPDC000396]|uniref:TetR/AcrR family transcriptional regulator n=1 Tax=Streptosporangium sp. NPDC000396 TaxID=3366185 RepID=UPI0036B7EA5B
MPKIVDPETRRQEVAEAVFRVISREGVEQASLANVAAEAGLAIGSIRHYFASHGDLMTFAMRAMADRLFQRILGHVDRLAAETDRRAVAEDLLAEFLPLDEARRQESTVWLAFTTSARTRPELRPYARELYDGMRKIVLRVLTRARDMGRLAEGLDLDLETERLCALIDGLTVNAILTPERTDPATMLRVLRCHLDGISLAAGR